MKTFFKTTLLLLMTFAFQQSFAQLRGINYQAVAIDANGKEIAGMDNTGQPLAEKTIGVKFTILGGGQNGTNLYQETHITNTDQYGLFSLIIGDGTVSSVGTYSALINIPWSTANQFLKVELDLNNIGDFKVMSIQQFMAVPYAFYALNTSTTNVGPTGPQGPQGTAGVNGTNGTNGTNGSAGLNGVNGLASLIKTTVETAGLNCANGGFKTEYGLDANSNNTLDAGEIISAFTQYVCNGAAGLNGGNGTNGNNSLIAINSEAAGVNCATGGVKVEYGLDANNNSMLDVSEINSSLTKYICNGASNGSNSLVSTVVELAGANCATGGIMVQYGLDANTNGILDAGEINASLTKYICNGLTGTTGTTGAAGTNGSNGSVVNTTNELAGANCATGGVKIEYGIDANNNGSLDVGEIIPALTKYVCNGANGTNGAAGINGTNGFNSLVKTTAVASGTNCATGGMMVEYGLDANSNSTLDIGEIASALTKYICNGTNGTNGANGATGPAGPASTQSLSLVGNTLSISGSNSVTLLTGADSQTLSINSNSISIANGNTITIPVSTDSQTLSVSGRTLNISNGNGVTIPSQSLTISSNSITISNGNTIVLPTGTDTQTLSIVGNNISIANGNTITIPTYTNGTGIAITSGSVITNTAPNQTVTLTGTGATTVTGAYPSYTVNAPAATNYNAGTGISITSGSVINTAPNQTITLTGTGAATVTGAYPNYTVNAPANTDAQNLSLTSNTLSITGGNNVVLPISTDSQTLSVVSRSITISNGNTVTIPSQTLSLTSNTLSISAGNNVVLPISTDSQTLSITSNTINISNGNSIVLPTGSDTQTLSVTGNSLSIANGNTVLIPTSTIVAGNSNITVSSAGNTYSVSAITPYPSTIPRPN